MPSGVQDRVRFDPYEENFDPVAVYRRLRDEDPVHHEEALDFWVLSRFEDVFAAALDTSTFSSARGLTFLGDDPDLLGLPPTLVMMDRPIHTTFRRLISRGFTPRRVATLEPAIRAFVRARVAQLLDAGESDFISVLASPLPTMVVATYLGVPESDRAQFDAWSDAFVQAQNSNQGVLAATDALAGLAGYFTHLVERRRADPGPDMLSDLAAARVDGEPLDVIDILGYCFVMIAGGNDTTTGMLGGSAALLAGHPEQRRALVKDPSLIANAVEELLRLTAPVQGLSRTTTRAVTIGDTTIPPERKVHLLYASANRDEREFGPTAEELDVSRRFGRMMTFSTGPHHCIGAVAARLQARVALEELLAAAPEFTVDLSRARFAPGPFIRRYEHLPFSPR